MAAIRHPNVVMFMGLCLAPVCVVTKFCARGSLSDVIRKAATSAIFAQLLDWPKRLSMALDAAKVGSLLCQHARRHTPSFVIIIRHFPVGLQCLPMCPSKGTSPSCFEVVLLQRQYSKSVDAAAVLYGLR